jgi:hypothetical protein
MSYSNIRIQSDGRPLGLKVTTRKGEEIPCASVHFTQNDGEAPTVTLVLQGVHVDLASADLEELQKQAQQAKMAANEARCRLDVV